MAFLDAPLHRLLQYRGRERCDVLCIYCLQQQGAASDAGDAAVGVAQVGNGGSGVLLPTEILQRLADFVLDSVREHNIDVLLFR
jgi:hypothetical protein